MAEEKYTVEQVINALEKKHGLYTLTATELGCHRHTVARYVKEHSEAIVPVLAEIEERMKDRAEGRMFESIDAREGWAIRFYLSRKAKDRGYGKELDITSGGMPLQGTLNLPSNNRGDGDDSE